MPFLELVATTPKTCSRYPLRPSMGAGVPRKLLRLVSSSGNLLLVTRIGLEYIEILIFTPGSHSGYFLNSLRASPRGLLRVLLGNSLRVLRFGNAFQAPREICCKKSKGLADYQNRSVNNGN